jgi:hypothetical protein
MNINLNDNQTNSNQKQLLVGNGLLKVLGFSPNKEQLAKIYGIEVKEDAAEREYVKLTDIKVNEQVVSVESVNIWVYVQEQKTGTIHPMFFTLRKHKEISSKGAICFINQFGNTSYADNFENLRDSMVAMKMKDKAGNMGEIRMKCREALMGEKDFYNFLKAWLPINRFQAGDDGYASSSLFMDNTKLFNGDFSELNNLLKEDVISNLTVIGCFGVKTRIKDDETEEDVQVVSSRYFMKGKEYPRLNNFTSKPDAANIISQLTGKYDYDFKQFSKDVNDPQYGFASKVHYFFEPIANYDSSRNPVANNDAVVDNTSSDY